MELSNMKQAQIETLDPDKFKELIIDEMGGEEDELEENHCKMVNLNGKDVVLLGNSEIDGGLDLPCINYTYNLRKVQVLNSTGSYYTTSYEKIDKTKVAYAYYSSDGWKELVVV